MGQTLKPGAEVLEIGCGGGIPVTRTLVDADLKLWAIDASPTLISIFKARFPDIPTQCASVLESDFFQRQYDAAIAIGLIFLLRAQDQYQMLNRVSAVLRPGAHFLFTAPVEIGTWQDVNTHHTCRSLGQDAYENALEQAGFRGVGHYQDRGKNHYYATQKGTVPP